MNEKPMPHFTTPPLMEVVVGVTFKAISDFKLPHFGMFWETVRDHYPNFELAPIAGDFEEILEEATGAPLPRFLMVSKEDDQVLQLQRNRLVFNWRKRGGDYPNFEAVYKSFAEHYKNLGEFLKSHDISLPGIGQCELAYVNHIPKGEGWEIPADAAAIFPIVGWNNHDAKIVTNPSAINWQNMFDMPDNLGSLLLKVQTAVRRVDGQPILAFELVARGGEEAVAPIGMDAWFKAAHYSIGVAFSEFTDDKVQVDRWGRQK